MVFLLCLLILVTTLLGLFWHMRHYEMVDLKFYPKDAQTLDLRGEKISVSHYEKLTRRFSDTEILWDVPFQEELYRQDIQTLSVAALKEEDLKRIGYFEKLQTVDARECTDYALLQKLQKAYPEIEVQYQVTLGGRDYLQDAASVRGDGMTEEELALLQYLPELAEVCVEGAADLQVMEALKAICAERNIAFRIMIGGEGRSLDTTELLLKNTTGSELALLPLLPNLTKVHIQDPQMEAEELILMVETLPDVTFTWEKEVLGVLISSDTKEVDLLSAISEQGAKAYEAAKKVSIHGDHDETTWLFRSDSDYPLPKLEDKTGDLIAQVRRAMAYFPNVERVLMTGAYLDNEAMAVFREEVRSEYKVVWSVQCGGIIARTDTPYFMPTKYHVYYFQDDESENLKYCEDMICVDVGHMAIKHVEWAAYMPNLQYLILAHTDVRSIEPLRNCKELKFLEVDWSALKDFSPLLECKKLEDLNLGNTYGNFEVIEQMTWLKNVWLVGCSRAAAYRITQALQENTHVVASGTATVSGGWRELPNYYAMRDIMNMYYMEW